jgi:DNA-binding transcriptional LysR family regulator
LKVILREFEPQPLPVYVVYPSRRHLSAKVRAFADFPRRTLCQGRSGCRLKERA